MNPRYCGRDFSPGELDLIRRLIAEDPARSRAELSRLTCQALDWRKPDGGLKAMSARVAMLRMQEDGFLRLPPPRNPRPDPRVRITAATDPGPLLEGSAAALRPLKLRRVLTKPESRRWNEFIERYHYLGCTPLPGAQLRYFVYAQGQLLALLGFAAAAWKTAPRDRYIGWDPAQRERNLPLIVNNARFLILPWVRVPHLASMVLAQAARVLPHHWQDQYGLRPVLLETFVETPRFRGTCYRAANWIYLGRTQGRGKLGANQPTLPVKDIWVYPLARDFREQLGRQ